MKTIRIIVLPLLLAVHGLAWGGLDEGEAAYNRGDYATALEEWRPLAEQGHAIAQYSLGIMYYQGKGVPEDYKEAVKWYRRAAEQSIMGAQYFLGVMYDDGLGVPQDYVQAHMWYNIASANGSKAGTKERVIISGSMTSAQVAEAQKLAREWMEKHP